MANLKNFISPNLRVNQKFNIYVSDHIKVGELVPNTIENLRLKVTGSAQILGQRIEGEIEILMENENASGFCTIVFNGHRLENVAYRTENKKLTMEPVNHDLVHLILASDRGNNWSMVGTKFGVFPAVWVGVWSPAKANAEVDFATFPKEYEAV